MLTISGESWKTRKGVICHVHACTDTRPKPADRYAGGSTGDTSSARTRRGRYINGSLRAGSSEIIYAMGSRTDGPSIEATKSLMTVLLGAKVEDNDDGSQNAMCDLEVRGDPGVVLHSIEVTAAALPKVLEARRAIEELAAKDLGLVRGWGITIHETARIKPIEAHAPALLNGLAAAGVRAFDWLRGPFDDEIGPIVRDLKKLGVEAGHIYRLDAPKRLQAMVWGSGSQHPMDVTEAIEKEIRANQSKLLSAPGARKHLVVWMHWSNWRSMSQLLDLEDPLPPVPDVPEGIDIVWVAVEAGDGSVAALLRVDENGLVELEPHTGEELPDRRPSPDDGPPSVPTCPECGAPGMWTPSPVTAHLRTGPVPTFSWHATCTKHAGHWTKPGRPLAHRELRVTGLM